MAACPPPSPRFLAEKDGGGRREGASCGKDPCSALFNGIVLWYAFSKKQNKGDHPMIRTNVVDLSVIPAAACRRKLPSGKVIPSDNTPAESCPAEAFRDLNRELRARLKTAEQP